MKTVKQLLKSLTTEKPTRWHDVDSGYPQDGLPFDLLLVQREAPFSIVRLTDARFINGQLVKSSLSPMALLKFEPVAWFRHDLPEKLTAKAAKVEKDEEDSADENQ